jgi:perosamine synthetase
VNPLGYSRQWITEDDVEALRAAARRDHLTTGPGVDAFEAAFSRAIGAPGAAAVANGTAALHLAALAMGAGPGRVALVPAITFVATANAFLYAGARPHFVDVDPTSGLLDLDRLDEALAEARRLGDPHPFVAPVHLAGLPVDMDRLATWAREHGCDVLEDACHAPGASYPVGTGGSRVVGNGLDSRAAAFSFHPVKHLTTGEGGAVTSAQADILGRVRLLRSHGIERDPARLESAPDGPWSYELQALGFNYRLADLVCALGESQCARLPEGLARRRALVARYATLFRQSGLSPEHVVLPVEPPGFQSAWHLYVIRLRGALLGRRAHVWEVLRSEGIGAQVHYIPLPRQPLYRRLLEVDPARFPGAEEYYEGCLSIPLFPTMTSADQDRVVDALSHAVGRP